MTDLSDPLLTLPESLRDAFKEPLGPVTTDTAVLGERVDETRERHGSSDEGPPRLIAVGDVVTYHLLEAGHRPAVAVVDGRTEREAVDEEIRETLSDPDTSRTVSNRPGTLEEPLLGALADAIDAPSPVTIAVDGEEDLATLPAVLVAPTGGTVVYGQPGEGMVAVAVTDDAKTEMRSLLERMDGDVDGALAALGVDG